MQDQLTPNADVTYATHNLTDQEINELIQFGRMFVSQLCEALRKPNKNPSDFQLIERFATALEGQGGQKLNFAQIGAILDELSRQREFQLYPNLEAAVMKLWRAGLNFHKAPQGGSVGGDTSQYSAT